jgi:flagellar biosynthetic protein FliP
MLNASRLRPLRSPAFWLAPLAALSCVLCASVAAAQSLTLDLGPGGGLTERALQLVALVTVLAVAPSIVIMVTAFTRIVVVLSLLRSAIGTQTAPPNFIIISLAMFLTGFVMAPTIREA